MTITVKTFNAKVQQPASIELNDRSGAHVALTLMLGDNAPMRHAFAFTHGQVTLPLTGLDVGKHRCTLFVEAFKHTSVLNRSYDVDCSIGGTVVASAKGKIASDRTNDIGSGDFVLDVKAADE